MEKFYNEKKSFSLLFGPPFPTGEPHFGHAVNFVLKDVLIGFNKRLGNDVFGTNKRFDVHGLPTESKVQEIIIKKMLEENNGTNEKITIKYIIEKIGMGEYNRICKEYVLNVMDKWPITFSRLCPNIGYERESTMDFSYMNSLWYLFSKLYKKGLIYRSNKVQPYSAECETCISNFEANLNYKKITDKSVYVLFKIELHEESVNLIVWTTTPYTLLCNMALCINENIEYEMFKINEKYYVSSQKYRMTLTNVSDIKSINVNELKGKKYEPIFNYCKQEEYKIIWDNYVENNMGTGIVHNAPAYGADDLRVCKKFGIVNREGTNAVDLLNSKCEFNESVPDFFGRDARNCNKDVVKLLKSKNVLFKEEDIVHSFNHCWRTDKPLYNKLTKTVSLNVEILKDTLLCLINDVNFPTTGKERMIENIKNAPDWCLSRTRIWGTPINIWINEFGDMIVPESKEELEKLCVLPENTIDDIHLDKIKDIVINKDGNKYRHIGFVFDCWYESGAQWFAQNGYMHDVDIDCVDAVLEGIDQTRGWFYTLLVLSTAYCNKVPYKNVIVNGLVLDNTGTKLSKKSQNYTDIKSVITKYDSSDMKFGSDALRLYLLNSSSAKGCDFKFNESDISVWIKNVILPFQSTRNLFKEYINLYKKLNITSRDIIYENIYVMLIANDETIANNLDFNIWILKKFRDFMFDIVESVKSFNLYKLPYKIENFIECLTNKYCKFTREMIKGKIDNNSWKNSLLTLGYILANLSKILLNVIPETSNEILDSLIELQFIDVNFDRELLTNIDVIKLSSSQLTNIDMIDVTTDIGYSILSYRAKYNKTYKKPIRKIYFGLQKRDVKLDLTPNFDVICDVSNVLELEMINVAKKYKAVPIMKEICPKFRSNTKYVLHYIEHNNDKIIGDIERDGIHYFDISNDHVTNFKGKLEHNQFDVLQIFDAINNTTLYESDNVVLYVCEEETEEMVEMFVSRFFASRIQQLRKKLKLKVTDDIEIKCNFLKIENDIEFIDYQNLHCIINKNIKYIEGIIGKNITFVENNYELLENEHVATFVKKMEKNKISFTIIIKINQIM